MILVASLLTLTRRLTLSLKDKFLLQDFKVHNSWHQMCNKAKSEWRILTRYGCVLDSTLMS
eukprot:4504817-Amphidinium_carterae.1